MNVLPFLIVALLVYVLAYRFYAAFITAKVLTVNAERTTPAVALENGSDFIPMNKLVTFGHHFAAIAGAGPLIGPILAAQFGFLPGFIWLLIGSVLGGAVHDLVILIASVRNEGRSFDYLAKKYVSSAAGITAAVASLFIIVCALAGLSIAVINALAESIWATFTVAMTIPIAMFAGLWIFKFRPGRIIEGSVIGVILVLLAVAGGHYAAVSEWGRFFVFTKKELSIIIPVYGFIASVLPVWLLLTPRDYLSSYMKIGTIALVTLGVFIVMPTLQMPMVTDFIHGGGPIIKGPVWPFVAITIMCGAVSGFHALISSGTTPKMISSESHLRFVGYGAMLMESFVAMIALIAACALPQGDYFAINVAPEVFAKMNIPTVHLAELSQLVAEDLAGRTGGAVCMAVGMTEIFINIPFLKSTAAFWYHFLIMFEALFILTTVDAGSRVLRYIVQELLGRKIPKLGDHTWVPGTVGVSLVCTLAWGWLLYNGDISTIWPMFGVANQLLASAALAIGTVVILTESSKRRYSLITFLPYLFVTITVAYAGILNIINTYIPKLADPEKASAAVVQITLTVIMLVLVGLLSIQTGKKAAELIRSKKS